MRLDQILLDENRVSEDKITEALTYQRRFGGRLENHLFRLGYVDEEVLLKSLARQFRCKYVVLSRQNISSSVLEIIPPDAAWFGLVLPFEYNPRTNVLKIACENPTDEYIRRELEEYIPGKTIQLYLSLGPVLKCAIMKYYRDRVPSSNDFDGQTDKEPRTESVDGELQGDSSPAVGDEKKFGRNLLLYNGDGREYTTLTASLRHQGIIVKQAETIDQLSDFYRRQSFDIIILMKNGNGAEVLDFLADLDGRGIVLGRTVTFLINEDLNDVDLPAILELGLEDVIPSKDMLDLLIIKVGRVYGRLNNEQRLRVELLQDLGTHGSLADMNIVDLLQTLGPIRKTARIDITASGQHLALYLDEGNIIFAECDQLHGAEAVYQAISWQKGIWSIVPVEKNELPEPNNDLTNDAILLEGCRIIDELNRSENTPSQ